MSVVIKFQRLENKILKKFESERCDFNHITQFVFFCKMREPIIVKPIHNGNVWYIKGMVRIMYELTKSISEINLF
jgi:hypothetical protein